MTAPDGRFAKALEPDRSRYRLRVVRAVACVLVLLLAACSSGAKVSRSGSGTPGISLPGGTAEPQNSKDVCTQADLDGPVLAMPTPQVISSSVFLRTGIVASIDPIIGGPAAPFTATQAWAKFTSAGPLRAQQAELMLGTFSAILPYGPRGPERVSEPAWVLHVEHLAYRLPPIGKAGGTAAGKAAPVCQFVDAVLVLNANTGAVVIYSY